MAEDDEDEVATAEAALADAGLLVGVDITPPGIEIDELNRFDAALDENDDNNLTFSFAYYDDLSEDSNSGLHSLPLLVSAQKRNTSMTDCLDISDAMDTEGEVAAGAAGADCDDPTALPAADGGGTAVALQDATHAYYTLRATALDKAGNYSEPLSHTFVFDAEVATATAPAAPRIEAGEAFEVASFLNDDLSIRDYYVTANFGDIKLGVVHPTAVDAFDADPLTYRNEGVSATVSTYTVVQSVNAGWWCPRHRRYDNLWCLSGRSRPGGQQRVGRRNWNCHYRDHGVRRQNPRRVCG